MLRKTLHCVALVGALLAIASLSTCSSVSFKETGQCTEKHVRSYYKYKVEQSQFEKENKETLVIVCTVVVTCEKVGTYGTHKAKLYSLVVTGSKVSGNMLDKDEKNPSDQKMDINDEVYDGVKQETPRSIDNMMKGWFKFVQTEDGSIPAVFHSRSEDSAAVNFKKTIAAAFQANFEGTASKMEADSQSIHKAKYTYSASAQDKANGIVKMHRKVTSDNVQDFSTHIPKDDVAVNKDEDIVYRRGVLTHSAGVTTAKIMPVQKRSSDVESDSLEAEMGSRRRRDMSTEDYFDFITHSDNDVEENSYETWATDTPAEQESDINDGVFTDGDSIIQPATENDYGDDDDDGGGATVEGQKPSYDSQTDLPVFDAVGTYSLDLVGQKRVLKRDRRADLRHLELPEATESTLMAHVDHTQEDKQRMFELHSRLTDIQKVLNDIHKDPNGNSANARKIEELISLEAQYGSLPEATPIIDVVIGYLHQLVGSEAKSDVTMRALLYFMLSKSQSFHAQRALVEALDSAVNEEEECTVVMYIAFTEHPQPELVAELEERMESDSLSTNPLLLAYGALVAKASPDLQQRMTQFLVSQLSSAETNTSSLIHHILALGNTESHHTTTHLMDYLTHPDQQVQLSSIYALRYATANSAVLKALSDVVRQSNTTDDDHLAMILHCLLFGLEHASNTRSQKPFDFDLAFKLFSVVMTSESADLQQMLKNYLNLVDNKDSVFLVGLMRASPPANNDSAHNTSTRNKRGTDWAERNSVYDLVSPLSTRQSDLRVYGSRKSYIWGKMFGVSKANVQIAAGGFVGVAKNGGYKLFGRAKAIGYAFGKTKTALDFLVLRQKTGSYTLTRLYAEIVGKTLVNVYDRSKSSVCKRYSRPLYNPRKFTLFNFGISIFIYVGTLRFHLAGYVKLNTNMYVNFCENRGSITAEAGVLTTVTLELEGGATANILLLARGGISVSAVFNYNVQPKLSTTICLTNYKVRVKNCAGIYHGWSNNKIVLDTWYQLRSIKWCKAWRIPYPCGITWGSRKRWNALSTSWSLWNSPLRPLLQACDRNFVCSAVSTQDEAPPPLGMLANYGPVSS